MASPSVAYAGGRWQEGVRASGMPALLLGALALPGSLLRRL